MSLSLKNSLIFFALLISTDILPQSINTPKASPMHVRLTRTSFDGNKFIEIIKNSDLRDISIFKSKTMDSSAVLDSVLIARALLLAGIRAEFEVITIPNSAREREMINEGKADVAGVTQWDFYKEQFASTCFFSDTVIPDGFFEKGLYTTKEKSESIKITSSNDLSKYSVALNKYWIVDWKTLEGLYPKIIYDTPTRQTMFSMVFNGRADLTLQGFSTNADLSIEENGIRLYPVRGVKVVLKGTRHFMINKKNRELYVAVERGLKIMKKDNSLMTILKQSGFYNTSTENWKILRVQ
jgi:hypothetical protein